MSDTRQRILDTAREMFNEHGLHRVGVREIARAVEMSPGNLSYHFATKDQLVSALILELHQLSAQTAFADFPENFSLVTLHQVATAAMRNMLTFRFLMFSYVDAVLSSPELQSLEHSLWPKRRARSEDVVARLIKNGYLDGAKIKKAKYLHEQGEMVSSNWLRAAVLHPDQLDDESALLHYAKVGIAILEPYCSEKGLKQMRKILAGEYDST